MIFEQYTLNGKRRVSNGKRHVIQRKQTRENVRGLCLNANSCMRCIKRAAIGRKILQLHRKIKRRVWSVCMPTVCQKWIIRCVFLLVQARYCRSRAWDLLQATSVK